MALETAVKYKIIRLLGWPAGTLDPASLDYNNIVTRRLEVIQSAAEVEINSLLASIAKAEVQLDKFSNRAGIKKIDDIEFYESAGDDIRGQRNRYVRELSDLLGIPTLRGSSMGGVVV